MKMIKIVKEYYEVNISLLVKKESYEKKKDLYDELNSELTSIQGDIENLKVIIK